jgi:rod shape-determining protein MreC
MDTFLGRYRNLIVLAAILFAQIIGLALQVRRPTEQGETRLIRLWAVSAVSPFESAAIHSQSWVRNVWTTYIYLHGVRRENRELRAQLEQMRIEETRLSEDAHMARRIQALLAFKEQYVDSTIAAQVIGTSGSDQSRVLYIDKGSNDGIAADMAVITPTGIVGKIVQVFPDSSQVLPINDQFSGVGAALKDSRLQGILKGTPSGATTLQYIMSDETVKLGEDVITSGGDRIFPKGLPVGKVIAVEPGKDLFLNIRVIPSARLDQLEEVLVVTKMTEKMPDTKDLGPLRASDILAERLPSVPNKAEVDAAGNAKPTGAPGAAPANATASANKPPQSSPTTLAGKPATTATTNIKPTPAAASLPRATAPGTAPGTNGTLRPKPVIPTQDRATAVKARTDAADAQPGDAASQSKPKTADDAMPAPAKAKAKAKPSAEPTPSTTPEQPAAAPSGAPPPQ